MKRRLNGVFSTFPAKMLGYLKYLSYIYGINEAQSQAFIIKNKGYE